MRVSNPEPCTWRRADITRRPIAYSRTCQHYIAGLKRELARIRGQVIRKAILFVAILAASPIWPASADDRALIAKHMQEIADSLAPGDAHPYETYLDSRVIFVEEDDSFKAKDGMVKETTGLPKGLSGNIKMELLSYNEDGDTAVALFRQHETEQYYGQTIHASYLTNTTWKKRTDGWKIIEAETLAERTDPPAIALPSSYLAKFAGTYRLRNSVPTYTLVVESGKLVGGHTGRKPSQWNAETRDVFFIAGDPRIRRIFEYDAKGDVTGFIERRESWTIYWDKTQ